MFAKLVTVIVVLGAMFGALLVNRQQRIDAASEISRIHFRMLKHERARNGLQSEVAAAVRPDRLRERIASVASDSAARTRDGRAVQQASRDPQGFKPIPFRQAPSKATDDALGGLGTEVASGEGRRNAAGRGVG